MPSVHEFGMKVPHLRCDSHTSFKVKRSKVGVNGQRSGLQRAGEYRLSWTRWPHCVLFARWIACTQLF